MRLVVRTNFHQVSSKTDGTTSSYEGFKFCIDARVKFRIDARVNISISVDARMQVQRTTRNGWKCVWWRWGRAAYPQEDQVVSVARLGRESTGWGAAVAPILENILIFPLKCWPSVCSLGRPTRLNPPVPRLRLQFSISDQINFRSCLSFSYVFVNLSRCRRRFFFDRILLFRAR